MSATADHAAAQRQRELEMIYAAVFAQAYWYSAKRGVGHDEAARLAIIDARDAADAHDRAMHPEMKEG